MDVTTTNRAQLALRARPTKRPPRTEDKYIMYVYTCLRRDRVQLTDDEVSQMFGPNVTIFAELDPIWFTRFLGRCVALYQVYAAKHLSPSSSLLSDEGTMLYKANTGPLTSTTIDGYGRIVRITRMLDGRDGERELPSAELARFETEMIVFENAVFTKRSSRVALALMVWQESSRLHHDPSAGVYWEHWFTVKDKDIRGLDMDTDFVYTSDGALLYTMARSWKAAVCLTFDRSCRTDTILTVCALAMGDPELGGEFKLRCNLPDDGRAVDLRDVRPLRPAGGSPPETRRRHNPDQDDSDTCVDRGLTCLAEMIKVPAGFSIVAENDTVMILRHILRDAIVVVPKAAAVVRLDSIADCHDTIVPSGCLTEWFACDYSSFVVNRGIDGVPPLVLSAGGNTAAATSACTGGARPKVATLRVLPAKHYNRAIPILHEPQSYMFDRAVCLLPGLMAIVAPNALDVPSCIAVMYCALTFRALMTLTDSERTKDPIALVFARPADLTEADVIMATYMSLSNSFAMPSASTVQVSVDSPGSLVRLREKLVSNPRPVARTPAIHVSDAERTMTAEVEGVLLDMQQPLYYPDEVKRAEIEMDSPCTTAGATITRHTPRCGQDLVPTGHCVLFGHGAEGDKCFERWTIGLRSLGLFSIKILRACGLFDRKHGTARATLLIPNTRGVIPAPKWLGESTSLSDDMDDVDRSGGTRASRAPPVDQTCFFQLNYSPPTPADRGMRADVDGAEVRMSPIEQAVCSAKARGYEEQRLARLFRSTRAKHERCLFDVETEQCAPPGCQLEKRSWLVSATGRASGRRGASKIGDGEFFPSIDVASDSTVDIIGDEESLASPLAEYKLNLSRKPRPGHHAMGRADRSVGECGCAYEACLDEAVLLGHGIRVTDTKGAKKNFDVSACLTSFYRAVHPCVPDMKVGDMMLDYEFAVHGRGLLHPVYALLSHLAQSCRLQSFPSCRLITLSRHRAASAWTRGTDATTSHTSRANIVGALLCAQDPRLSILLARCCNITPLFPKEFYAGSGLLSRGDEEELLLEAYARTLGPAYVFEPVTSPSRAVTSLGEWRFLRLRTTSEDTKRFPGVAAVDGYTVAFASESPLFYLAGEGPLVQRLESVAVIVDSSSRYRTDVLKNETPDWPDPDAVQDPIRCKPRHTVLAEMFMRVGKRDPLETASVDRGSWSALTRARWTFSKGCSLGGATDWENEYPVSQSLCDMGPRKTGSVSIRWLCGAPPDGFSVTGDHEDFGRVELYRDAARSKDPLIWRGFDILCSRVLTCPTEKMWSTGLCLVKNHGLDAVAESSRAPAARLIVIVAPNEWHARPATEQQREKGVDRAVFSETQVSSAAELIRALAGAMLSGSVHEDIEIRCCRTGVYSYIQRALVWLARAAGPFRSRAVTVFTPEAAAAEPWTHALPAGLDVLKSSKKKYIVSCTPDCSKKEDVSVMIADAEAVIKVNGFGNLVLHANRRSVRLSREQREAGVHVIAETAYGECTPVDTSYHHSDTVYIYSKCSLKRFCESHAVPKGIRGPEVWTRPLPWSKAKPANFCFKVSELKYRWESGIEEPEQAPARNAGVGEGSPYDAQVRKWTRCTSDRLIVPKGARFWYSVDHKRSLLKSAASSDDESECASSDDESDGLGRARLKSTCEDSIALGCRWHDDAMSSSLTLNSYVTVEFVWSPPALAGHVFFEPVYNSDYTETAELTETGKLIKFYKPHKYRSLTRDLYTVMLYGCGLTPVFTRGKGAPDAASDNVLYLALRAMAVSHHITQIAHLPCRKVTVVVPGGRDRALTVARNICRGVVVVTPAVRREGVMSYHFKGLPDRLDAELGSSDLARRSSPETRLLYSACPIDFLGRGESVSLYLKLTKRWPNAAARDDVKHPTSSRDPRWIGLMLCLAEWEGERDVADLLIPGAMEYAMRTLDLLR